jgi:predicted nucleic acid-binding protein
MIVVADTSPVNYLILISEIDVLTKMYGKVVIPHAPETVRTWIAKLPAWVEVRSPSNTLDASLAELDEGQREAIMLASELGADQLIVDDRQGRYEAVKRCIPVIGTLGVLREVRS